MMLSEKRHCYIVKMKNGWETQDMLYRDLSYEEAAALAKQGYKVCAVGPAQDVVEGDKDDE